VTPICRCAAYPWPHRTGSGRCDSLTTSRFPLNIATIVKQSGGVTLAQLSDGTYIVGLNYHLGMELDSFRPLVDFLLTSSLDLADRTFKDRSNG